jgi:LmbE family N-acetylglucosaminyl deacetylase
MLSLGVHDPTRKPLRILCLGAHSDDIEIGCGGLLLSVIQSRDAEVEWIVFSGRGRRKSEAQTSARLFLAGARRARVTVRQFRDGFFPYQGADIKAFFERLKRRAAPDLVLTHYRDDRHQDHRLLSDLTWNTFRDHWILEYEIPKFDGDLGSPNAFIPLDQETCALKVKHLQRVFASQRDKDWFTPETFMAMMRLRGMECRAPSGYAEAFYSRKTLLQV